MQLRQAYFLVLRLQLNSSGLPQKHQYGITSISSRRCIVQTTRRLISIVFGKVHMPQVPAIACCNSATSALHPAMLRACRHVGLTNRDYSGPWFKWPNTRTGATVRPTQPCVSSLRAHSTDVDVVIVGGGHAGTFFRLNKICVVYLSAVLQPNCCQTTYLC